MRFVNLRSIAVPSLRLQDRRADMVTQSILDPRYYAKHQPELAETGLGPSRHFLLHGAPRNRWPSKFFSPNYVLNYLSDQPLVGSNPVAGYLASDLHRKPRLVFVSHEASRTGAPAIILRLLEMFSESRRFECFSLFDVGGERLADFQEFSHTHVMSRQRYDKEFSDQDARDEIAQLFSADGVFQGNRPVCALVNSAESVRIGRNLASLGIPVVSLLHEFADFYRPEIFEEFCAYSKKVIFPSNAIMNSARSFCRFDESKTMVRGQGLLDDWFGHLDRDNCRAVLREELGVEEDAFIVLNVGSMDFRKGIDLFAQAACRYFETRATDRPVYFVWYGHWPAHERSAYLHAKRLLEQWGIEDRVMLMPPTAEIERIFIGGDLFLTTARADPFPCVIHEAMACGLPVVGFRDSGGAIELVGDDCGEFVAMGDIRTMARAIASCIDDPELYRQRSETAVARIRTDWKYQDYFRDVAKVMERVSAPSPAWRDIPLPSAPDHLVLMPGSMSSVEAFRAAFRDRNLSGVEVALIDGRFGSNPRAAAEALRAMGVRYRFCHAVKDEETFKIRALARLMTRARPGAATLIDVLQFADPDLLKLLGYPKTAVLTGRDVDARRLYPFLPVLQQVRCADPDLIAEIRSMNPTLGRRVVPIDEPA